MPTTHIGRATLVWLLLGAFGCDEETAEPSAVESAPSTLEGAGAEGSGLEEQARQLFSQIGGTAVAAGNLHVEVKPFSTNQVHALVLKPDGELEEGAELRVSVKGSDGEMHPIAMSWSGEEARFVGELEGDVEIRPGPVDVTVTVDDTSHEGHLDTVAIAPVPAYGGEVLVAGEVSAEVRALPEGVVEAVATGPSGVVTADSSVELNVALKGSDDAMHDVALTWQPNRLAWVGQLEGDLTVAPGALRLDVVQGGETHSAQIAEVGIVAPTHEGDIVSAGDMAVELVPKGEGELSAHVYGSDGAAIEDGATLKVEVVGAPEPVTLAWNAEASAYVGAFPPAIDVSAAPLRVVVEHNGRIRRGGLAVAAGRRLGVAWRQRLESGAGGAIPPGQARRLGLRVEARGPSAQGELRGRGRGLSVMGPPGGRAEVSVMGPSARVSVMATNPGAQIRASAMRTEQRVRNAAATAEGNLRRAVPMVSIMGAAMARGNAEAPSPMGGASAMAGASVMLGFGQ